MTPTDLLLGIAVVIIGGALIGLVIEGGVYLAWRLRQNGRRKGDDA